MDYSEIIIYIIVISIIFISSFKKKKTSQTKPKNVEQQQRNIPNIPQPPIPNNSPPQQVNRKIPESPDKVSRINSIPNLNTTVDNTATDTDKQEDIYNDISKNVPKLNREELRKAIITSEILKTKF